MPDPGDPAPQYVIDIIGEDAIWCESCSAWHPSTYDHEEIPLPVVISVPTFSDAREIRSDDGTNIGLITCNICGCALIMDMIGVESTLDLHTEWHHNG